MSLADPLDICLDLMRRLPPQNVEDNLNKLSRLVPNYAQDLEQSVDRPLMIMTCKQTGKPYLGCEYNGDDGSYRSPWSNEYDPPLPDGTIPSIELRKLEVTANTAFDTYRDMYFEGGISSVYLWETDDVQVGGFAGVVLFKKVLDPPFSDTWDSIHVFEVVDRGRSAIYKLTSTVMLTISTTASEGEGLVSLSGSMTRQLEQEFPVASATSHIPNIGKFIEDTEQKMRNQLQEVYFGKARDVVGELRSRIGEGEEARRRELQKELQSRMKR